MLNKLLSFTKKVQDLADKPNTTMTAAEVKAQFDAAPDELRLTFNQLIDDLQSFVDGDSGADNIGVSAIAGLTGGTVQSLLEELKGLDDTNRDYLLAQIQGVVLGQIPDKSITLAKLSADAKKASNIAVEDQNGLFISGDVEGALKEAIEKANSAFQSASDGKTAVSNAVTAKGVAASPSDTFPTLAAKIGQISTGKKFASGTVTASSSTLVFKNGSGGNVSKYHSTVTGLDFTPSVIILRTQPLGTSAGRQTVFIGNDSFFPSYPLTKITETFTYYDSTTGSLESSSFQLDGVSAYVNLGGFRMPSWGLGMTYEWFAFE